MTGFIFLDKEEGITSFIAAAKMRRIFSEKKAGHAPMAHALIIDGEIMEKSLSLLGFNHEWLEEQLRCEKLKVSEVFLFSYSENGERLVIAKESE